MPQPSAPRRSRIIGAITALIVVVPLLFAPTASADAPATEPKVVVGAAARKLALPLDEPLLTALRGRSWSAAARRLEATDPATLTGAAKADWAFLRAWTLAHAGQAEEALSLLPLFDGKGSAPSSYASLVRGEVLLDAGEHLEALRALEAVPRTAGIWPRAAVQQAEALRELGRTKEAFDLYRELVDRPDPADGNALALLALARHLGPGSDEAYPHLRRLWAQYPGTSEASEASRLLSGYSGARYRATWQETAARAERLMLRGDNRGALALLDKIEIPAKDDSVDACRALFTRGRARYRLNQLTSSVAGFGDVGARCVNAEGGYGPRGLYLIGTAEHRRRRYAESAAAYRQLTSLYPEHSMADDGLTRGGIALQEKDDLAGAQAMWREALERFPEGDTGPEAIWRLAFSLYLQGKGSEAREVAERLGDLPLAVDAVHVAAGRYWAARWALYPDVEHPTRPVADPARRQAAIDGFEDLITRWPHSFYSVLAWSRLRELAPERAAAIARPEGHDPGSLERPWIVRLSFHDDPAIRDGVALARLGLIREARAEWSALDPDALTGDEMAWLTELRIATGDWLFAHDDMRSWLKSHPVGTLGPREPQIIAVAYPDRYWDLVQGSAKTYRYEPRLFHALVREESNFNRTIVSFAGARGLSQLMPATAQQTAGWLGMKISLDDLDDPKTNLTIGARYLEAMHKDLSGSPYLSLAAYNAGAGRVKQWLTAWGNVPTDEYVERIPFRETREYVKRVMGTWQTVRYQRDVEAPPFYDLSTFNHQARP